MSNRSIQVSCVKKNLKKVRQFVSNVLEEHRLSAVDINLLVLAVDELCANLIIHSHACDPKEAIEVSVERQNEKFVFEIRDRNADFFNLSEYKVPDMNKLIKDRRGGGIGLILVRRIADEIHCEQRETMSIYRFSKAINSLSFPEATT